MKKVILFPSYLPVNIGTVSNYIADQKRTYARAEFHNVLRDEFPPHGASIDENVSNTIFDFLVNELYQAKQKLESEKPVNLNQNHLAQFIFPSLRNKFKETIENFENDIILDVESKSCDFFLKKLPENISEEIEPTVSYGHIDDILRKLEYRVQEKFKVQPASIWASKNQF